MFLSIYCPDFVVCRLFLTKESKSTSLYAPSTLTVSTEVMAAIPQEVEEETKGNSSPLESAVSDPVSLMAEPSSRSFMLFIRYIPTCGLRRWLYLFTGRKRFWRVKAGQVSILAACWRGPSAKTLPRAAERACSQAKRTFSLISPPQTCFGMLTLFVLFYTW